MTENLIQHLGYVGIILLLVLGGLGLPVPEEAPIILAAVLSKKGTMLWPMALGSCFIGVLLGDFVVYLLGFFYGEKVLNLRVARQFLTRAREAQIKGYFHRHGFKILFLGRFAVGFRTAAYLTAGILRLPMLKLFMIDLLAASVSTLIIFGLSYRFAEWIEIGVRELKGWVFVTAFVLLVAWLLYRYYKARRRAGLPVGPPVLMNHETPADADEPHPRPQASSETPAGSAVLPPAARAPVAEGNFAKVEHSQ
ncbi:MAG TPA: DedA family protein, partial [Isosphaeraceae bacterium]|nr:DedA family protein [Isosphaeraceae bacterium]